MSNLIIFNEMNSQEIVLAGLADASGAPVSDATITAMITRAGAALDGGAMTFAPVEGTPGSYTAMLDGFDAAPGNAGLVVAGSDGAVLFNFTIFATIAKRSL